MSSADYRADRRAANRATPALARPVVHDEQEPAGTSGSNDSAANAERIRVFGTAHGKRNVVRILGEKADLGTPSPDDLAPVAEDNGSIPLAGDTVIDGEAAIETTGVLGDGPHGSAGDGTNDFDFYAVDIDQGLAQLTRRHLGAAPPTPCSPCTTTPASSSPPTTTVATGFEQPPQLHSPSCGRHLLPARRGILLGPARCRPTRSTRAAGCGGAADQGPYRPAGHRSERHRLRTSTPSELSRRRRGRRRCQRRTRTSSPSSGPTACRCVGLLAWTRRPSIRRTPRCPAGATPCSRTSPRSPAGTSVHVAGEVGTLRRVQIEGYRPGAETIGRARVPDRASSTSTAVGSTPAIWGGPGVRTLTPFASFLAQLGARPRAQEATLVEQITATVAENIRVRPRGGGSQRPGSASR